MNETSTEKSQKETKKESRSHVVIGSSFRPLRLFNARCTMGANYSKKLHTQLLHIVLVLC